MCGILGLKTPRNAQERLVDLATFDEMTDTIAHRGPDERGTWHRPDLGIAFGHRRLSIRDLSPLGAQPMMSSCERYMMVYNGEVYSEPELKDMLAGTGRCVKGHSDTELMLECMAEFGVRAVLPKLIGMFAFGLYDIKTGMLTLARDRVGIKPLYWGVMDGIVGFSSELKALTAHPSWRPTLDRDALASFMRHNYIPAPRSIYKGIEKLAPGALVEIDADNQITRDTYWDHRDVVRSGLVNRDRHAQSESQTLENLDGLLKDAVDRRLVADVPLGALLSGGIDSSLVTALMTECAPSKVRTYAIGFHEEGFNEAPFASAIAKHLGTEHTELYVNSDDALNLVTQLPRIYDEPFADSSQIPTLMVCGLTREHVTVVLSGDGGDELFAGYSRYPYTLEQTFGGLAPPRPRWRRALQRISGLRQLEARLPAPQAQDDPQAANAFYRSILSHWHDPASLIKGAREVEGVLTDMSVTDDMPSMLDRMQYWDSVTYLPDDILTKVDRASMEVALEARVPLLDHRVVEMAWNLPQHYKTRDGVSKWALRQLLYKRVPQELIDRPKMGFGVPLGAWLRGPLREWGEALLDQRRLEEQGLFDPGPLRERWIAHQTTDADWGYPLWTALTALAWLDANPKVKI
jgi:asparagine synthase (glutamine-hydrolysing)